MPFFHFSQNNSGGDFVLDEAAGLTHHVLIEARDAIDANYKLLAIGGYFNGVGDGLDCPCCGDRWSELFDRKEGDDQPLIYGEAPAEAASPEDRQGRRRILWMPAGKEVCVHYADGRKVWY